MIRKKMNLRKMNFLIQIQKNKSFKNMNDSEKNEFESRKMNESKKMNLNRNFKKFKKSKFIFFVKFIFRFKILFFLSLDSFF